MRVSGFTIVRNGVAFDYPFEESIRSALPLVDQMVVNVGKSADETLARVRALESEYPNKLEIFETEWPLNDPAANRGGRILSEQTNLALDRCTGDWCLYIQADEVLHEQDYSAIRNELLLANAGSRIEALVFDYVHLYGSYDVEHRSRSAYRREVRLVRASAGPRSVGDAQSFRKRDGSKLRARLAGARIFHYGWVRNPDSMRDKTFFMDSLYHGEDSRAHTQSTQGYAYKKFWGLKPFRNSHPQVMRDRIETKGWRWDLSRSPFVLKWSDTKKIVSDGLERLTGWRPFEYRCYRLVSRD